MKTSNPTGPPRRRASRTRLEARLKMKQWEIQRRDRETKKKFPDRSYDDASARARATEASKWAQSYGMFLLRILKERGDIYDFKESKKLSVDDVRGIDAWGTLADRLGGAHFTIDFKSSPRSIKGYQYDRPTLIFVPLKGASKAEEADRLLQEIVDYDFRVMT